MQRQIVVKRRRRKTLDTPAEEVPAVPAADTADADDLLARIDELLNSRSSSVEPGPDRRGA